MQVRLRSKILPRYWLEIDLSAIKENIGNLRAYIKGGCEILAVIKSNAYGHGILEVAGVLKDEVYGFAVSTIEEAVKLREWGVENPILFLSNPLNREELDSIFEYNITPTINSLYYLRIYNERARQLNKVLNVHLKIDTGMGRMGVVWEEKFKILETLLGAENINIVACFTHFAHAEDFQYTKLQMERFKEVIQLLRGRGFYKFKLHAANSQATLRFPSAWFDLVRPGLILYGVYPDPLVKNKIQLKPAMSFKTRLVEVKRVRRGSYIGYCCTYKAPSDTKIGIIPVGYSQGIPWGLSNKGCVLLRGRRVPILGRISMDQIILDLKEIEDPKVGEEVVIVGRQGGEEIRVEEISSLVGTIPYELLCNLGKCDQRIYIGKEVTDEE